jgi:hypothetical protein
MTRIIVLFLCCVSIAAAQTITGSITGSVTDPSGAAVTSARVIARNNGTNVANTAEVNASGVYNLLFLPVGEYSLSVEAPGFKKSLAGPITLEVNQSARVDIPLQLGQVSDSVEISATAVILQTESATTGETITGNTVTNIPLKGRNFAAVTLLVPGAINPNTSNFTSIGRNTTGGRPYVNGNREQSNNFLLDGQEFNDSIDNLIGYNPSPDALEEVKVQTGNTGAEFGNANGAVVNMTVKGGTNQYHGNAFEFLQNDKLDANGFFANRSRSARAAFKRNIYGGTFGGPIKKDKLFFFVDYQGAKERNEGASTATVAPLAYRTGNLSALLTPSNGSAPRVVTDPVTGAPFPGNIIPANRIINPVAKALFADPRLYPAPNNIGTGALGLASNFLGTSASGVNNDQGDAKIDYRASAKDTLSGRFSISRAFSIPTRVALPTSIGTTSSYPTTGGVITWTRIISPSIVNEARAAFTRIRLTDTVVDIYGLFGATGNQKLGIPGGQPVPGISQVNLGGTEGMSSIGSIGLGNDSITNEFQYSDNFTKQLGRHVLKFGGQAARYQQNRYYSGNNGQLGLFTYDGRYTGSSFADFLLDDLAASGRGSVTGKWGHRHWRDGIFAQDDFRVSSTLTLNIGLRWEYTQPVYEVADRQINVNIYTGAVSQAGVNGASRALFNPYYKQFEPKLGFAWSPEFFGKKKFVVRGGYGITSFMEGTGANLRLPLNPPFFFESDVSYPTGAPGTITNGFNGLVGHNVLSGQIRAWNPDLRPAFIQQYNFTTEYEIAPSMSLNVGYVGQKGTHLVDPREGNQALVPSATNLQANRPLNGVLPLVTSISYTDSSATMSYNALQASLRKRYGSGIEFLASYTVSKTMSDNLGYYGSGGVDAQSAYWQNAYDRHGDYGPAFFDALHNFAFSGSYDLPFGKGRSYGANWNRFIDSALGGWIVGSVYSVHSGFPITLTSPNNSNVGARTARANHYRPLKIMNQTFENWFGTDSSAKPCAVNVNDGVCAYGVQSTNQFGNTGVGTERGPSFSNVDLALSKRFNISEQKYIALRADFFNAFNGVSFNAPDRTTNSSTFGLITSQINQPRNVQLALKFFF